MIQDLITVRERLIQLQASLDESFEVYSEEVEGIATGQDMDFIVEMLQNKDDMQQLIDKIDATAKSFYNQISSGVMTIERKAVPEFNYRNFINEQDNIMKMVEGSLLLPLHLDLTLAERLMELVYYTNRAGCGQPFKQNPTARFFMIAVYGWMIIKRYGGEFIKGNGLSVKIPKLNCIVEIERQSNNHHFFDWFCSVITELDLKYKGEVIHGRTDGIIYLPKIIAVIKGPIKTAVVKKTLNKKVDKSMRVTKAMKDDVAAVLKELNSFGKRLKG